MRTVLLKFCYLLVFLSSSFAHGSEIDSVRTIVTPVQCFGLRNGILQIDSVFGGQGPYFYSLDGQSFTTNPIFDLLWAGEYTLYVRDAVGATKDWQITVKEPADLQVKLLVNKPTIVAGEWFELRAIANVETDFLYQIEWLPYDLFSRQDTLRQNLSVGEATEFTVIVQDHNGCTASDRVAVEVEDAKLYFPNVIRPGSASDAYFTIFSGEGVKRVVSLQIYGRSGSQVFEQLDFQPNAPLLGWNGRYNGKVAQAGVYTYLAVVEFLDGKQVRYEGTVTVVN